MKEYICGKKLIIQIIAESRLKIIITITNNQQIAIIFTIIITTIK